MADYLVSNSFGDGVVRARLAAVLTAAYADSYEGFTTANGATSFHFAADVPADLSETLAPFTVSTQSKQLAELFQALADNTALDATTRATCQQAASTLNPA